MTPAERAMKSLNRLAKWRAHYAGWQLGTRPKGDPECEAVRDLQEARLLIRVEVTAITALLVEKGVITVDELNDAVAREAIMLDTDLAAMWPGVHAEDHGLVYDQRAKDTMKGWRP